MANAFVLLINALQNDEERRELRARVKELRDESDALPLPEYIFRGIFRISRQTSHDLIIELSPFLRRARRAQIAIPEQLKILIALQFFGHGSYQKSIGEDYNFPMSQSSVSRCINEVATAISENMQHLIRFPQTERERTAEKQKFLEAGGFPGIIGTIDYTHIAIIAPPTNDPEQAGIIFYNRKGYYSLNVQIICSADLKILGINARYSGSVHDSAIWMTSAINAHMKRNFERGDNSSWLIGDSGYPLVPWLMTSILENAADYLNDHQRRQQVVRYNATHRRSRNVIERLNGVLKAKFRCLLKHRTLHYDPITSAKIINSCAILYNFYRQRGEINIDEIDENGIDEPPQNNIINNVNNDNNLLRQGRNVRDRILRHHFNN